MAPQEIAFFVFAFLTLICGVFVIINKNPVTCAMSLVLCIISMAGLFVLLGAYFLAAVQVLVYAGAVIVLFLFVIMLLDLKEEARRRIRVARGILGVVAVASTVFLIIQLIWRSKSSGASAATLVGSTAELGRLLFTRYLLPFEILSILLLVAMLGVILLSKKELK